MKSRDELVEIIRESKLYQGFQCNDYVIRVGLANQLAQAILDAGWVKLDKVGVDEEKVKE